ncbi:MULTISPECIES: S8 family serine peptidase [Streptomyces]|uniref:S8 family serine peptidase n=1 Tax=Streptomyces mirabilis TaxID=68239 RepID=A0ABU3UWU4_9ACTN|nr:MULTISPECIES: S8 family serine peptidase [Streptomyces]MCX4607777.1 S8 family serine peptidase [Streptomyces mirabilis]MCX5348240.1 S8 family serine peptidase [Streptomyces mirabilis]MDU8998400.1 S8 family serine peptidase [Streptomyces mirabilis]NMI57374.1 S8 family serine peptidase [Streptomyces sp. RLA2-12]QDN56733.1 S8 family serine peptidase [Streptomyces sp. S1D4-20]
MAHLRSRRRLALAVPVVLSLTASLGFLPGAASAAPLTASATTSADGPNLAYVVNTRTDHRTIESVEKAISAAGGTVVIAYEKIGVIVVHSANPDFGKQIRAVRGVQSAGATRTAPLTAAGTTDEGAAQMLSAAEAAKVSRTAAAGEEPLEADQWDLRAIGADKAAKTNPGSKNVTVAVIDVGVDDTHPDIAPNFSPSQSANCVGGKPDTTYGAWRPVDADHYHGTHVAGEIAAARNGIGVAGVAPGVKVSGITVAEPDASQLFYPESVVCAFVFAADHGVEITNNSYYVDPWLYNCLDDPDQRAIVDAVNRAQLYAQKKGTLNVAAAGNSNDDLDSNALVDASSPDDSTAVTRTVDPHKCFDVPTQLPGVVTVASTGVTGAKSYFSSYGKGVIDVAAPGGDKYQIPDTPSKNGRILSTMPNNQYGFLQGTSMATPHVAGVAALLKSKYPWASPAQLQALLKAEADNPGCPTAPYDGNGDGVVDATCVGGKHVNGFYGAGIVNALRAVK